MTRAASRASPKARGLESGVPKRAAIYARFSTDMQRDASIDDQIRNCTARAARDGLEVVDTYADYAFSGASTLRPQWQAMQAAARDGRIDVIIAEALDRFSRDQEHIAAFYKEMNFAGVSIVTVAEGEISELHIGLKGTMNALFLKDLGLKTHRGLEGRVRSGRSAGGLSYGYRVVRNPSGAADPERGERSIEDTEAARVRQIFADYVMGRSPRAIACDLNRQKVPGPRGGKWSASLILGNAARETGILRNRLYVGELIWNRQRFLKDPSTGKRVSRPNPREIWVIEQVPALRIIGVDLWEAAQTSLLARRNQVLDLVPPGTIQNGSGSPTAAGRLARAKRPVWLLAGLVRCGVCDGPMTVIGADGRLGCANRRERGTCMNPRSILRERLTTRVLEGLKNRLLTPNLVEAFVRIYIDEVNAANASRGPVRTQVRLELSRIERQIANLLDMIKDGGGTRTLISELRQLEHRQEDAAARLAAADVVEALPALHPNLAGVYRQKVADLETALLEPAAAARAIVALRNLIDAILIFPGSGRGEMKVQLRGDLAAFLQMPDGRTDDALSATPSIHGTVAAISSGASGGVMGTLVAGTGFGRQLTLPTVAC
jgi:site-specific DNA recombinase